MSSCRNCGNGPSLPKKIINYTKASIKHLADGLVHTTLETQEERRSICRQCPFRDSESPVLICSHPDCGCYIDSKVVWASEECPIGLWDKYTGNKDLDENNNVNTPQL